MFVDRSDSEGLNVRSQVTVSLMSFERDDDEELSTVTVADDGRVLVRKVVETLEVLVAEAKKV